MATGIKFVRGAHPAPAVKHLTFPQNDVIRDPLDWNPAIAQSGGLHYTVLAHAHELHKGYTDVCDVYPPLDEFRIALSHDRMKAHSLWMSAPRPIADLLKPHTHAVRLEMIATYPRLLEIPGVAEQVLRDCPAEGLIPLLWGRPAMWPHAVSYAIVQRVPAEQIAEFIKIVPAAVKNIRDFGALPAATLVACARSGVVVHTVPITVAFRRAEAPSIKASAGCWTLWSNGMSTVMTVGGYVAFWSRSQVVLGGLRAAESCSGCDHCAAGAKKACGCNRSGCSKQAVEARPDTHRRVDGFDAGETVMFSSLVDGLPSGAFESHTAARERRGHLVAGVMHGCVTTIRNGEVSVDEYEWGIRVPAKSPLVPAPVEQHESATSGMNGSKSVKAFSDEARKASVQHQVSVQNAFGVLADDA